MTLLQPQADSQCSWEQADVSDYTPATSSPLGPPCPSSAHESRHLNSGEAFAHLGNGAWGRGELGEQPSKFTTVQLYKCLILSDRFLKLVF